jgi:signal transduction histidine kinase
VTAIAIEADDPVRHRELALALERTGLRVADREPPLLHLVAGADGVELRAAGEPVARFSAAIALDDLARAVSLVAELVALRRHLRTFEDAEPVRLVAAMVAHDARNALVPMQFAADALLGLPAPPSMQLARVIADGCQRLGAMLRRISSLRHGTGPEHVDVDSLISDLTPTLRALAGEQAQLATRLESPLPTVWIDPAELERAILNLVANARDASAPDGRIVVATCARSMPPNVRWVVVEVEDFGGGMDDATLARATEPFFTTKPDGAGTGLGLPSVARAARTAGGYVELESAPGRGTRARIWLPVARR